MAIFPPKIRVGIIDLCKRGIEVDNLILDMMAIYMFTGKRLIKARRKTLKPRNANTTPKIENTIRAIS